MMGNSIVITEREFQDQEERMVEEMDISEEEAEEVFKEVKTRVMLQAQEMDKNWSDETVRAITNLVIGIQQQQQSNLHRSRRDFYSRLFSFITGTLQLTATAFGVFLITAGHYIFGVGLLLLAVVSLVQQLRR